MATNPKITQPDPFECAPKVRRGAGPLYYKWCPTPGQKGSNVRTGNTNGDGLVQGCNNKIDNVVTYVYNILPDGNHLAYVFCDYVE